MHYNMFMLLSDKSGLHMNYYAAWESNDIIYRTHDHRSDSQYVYLQGSPNRGETNVGIIHAVHRRQHVTVLKGKHLNVGMKTWSDRNGRKC